MKLTSRFSILGPGAALACFAAAPMPGGVVEQTTVIHTYQDQ